MKAELIKIHQQKNSYNNDVKFIRLNFKLEDGTFAMTDVVPTFRNFSMWKPIIAKGVGAKINGITLINPKKVNADSSVYLI